MITLLITCIILINCIKLKWQKDFETKRFYFQMQIMFTVVLSHGLLLIPKHCKLTNSVFVVVVTELNVLQLKFASQ